MNELVFVPVFSVTNGGKTTLTNRLVKILPNCCVIHQDDFFKVCTMCTFAPSLIAYVYNDLK